MESHFPPSRVCIQQYGSRFNKISSTLKGIDFVKKSNKKYMTTADKRKREELLEKEDMMMEYLSGEIIPIERVPIKQLYPD